MAMTISAVGIDYLKNAEGGFYAKPYLDEGKTGRWTIGYGHLIKQNEHFPPEGIDEACAESLLTQDLAEAMSVVNGKMDKYGIQLSPCEFDALVSWIFNSNANESDLWPALAKHPPDYVSAISTLNKWIHGGVRNTSSWHVIDGLQNRRFDETVFFLSDKSPADIKQIMESANVHRLSKFPWTSVPIFLGGFSPEQQKAIMLAAGITSPPG
jgi:lysozyme